MHNLQPNLIGKLVSLRPMLRSDFDDLLGVASDPLIWELHPERNRHQKEVFERFFNAAIESKGALTILDSVTGEIMGCSRYVDFDPVRSELEVGYTFIARKYWGKGHNTEMKALMLGHAFTLVNTVLFYIGEENLRSRRAVEKLGATFVRRFEKTSSEGRSYGAVVYRMTNDKVQTETQGV